MSLTALSLAALVIALVTVIYGLARARGGKPFRPLFIALAAILAVLVVVAGLRAR